MCGGAVHCGRRGGCRCSCDRLLLVHFRALVYGRGLLARVALHWVTWLLLLLLRLLLLLLIVDTLLLAKVVAVLMLARVLFERVLLGAADPLGH